MLRPRRERLNERPSRWQVARRQALAAKRDQDMTSPRPLRGLGGAHWSIGAGKVGAIVLIARRYRRSIEGGDLRFAAAEEVNLA
jgi:hypothetical protein